jgi:hypothetical protein
MRHPVDPDSKMVSLQIPYKILDKIEVLSKDQDITRAEVIRRVLENHFGVKPYHRQRRSSPDKDWEKVTGKFIEQYKWQNPEFKKVELARAIALHFGISYGSAQDRISKIGV